MPQADGLVGDHAATRSTFGQGYSVNAVQMASVFATIANDGVRVPPRLVAGDHRRRRHGARRRRAPSGTRVVSPQTAADRAPDARDRRRPTAAPRRSAAIPGYRVGGKTGTAQRFDPACGCYRGYTASFIGMAPGRQARRSSSR